MKETTHSDLIKRNLMAHLLILFKLVMIALVLPMGLSYLIIGSSDLYLPYTFGLGPILMVFALYFWHIRGYWKILHVPPSGSYREVVISRFSIDEIADKMSSLFRFKQFEEPIDGLKFLIYPQGLTWSEYISIIPLSEEGNQNRYELISKTAGSLNFMKIILDGGRNYRNVQKIKETLLQK